MADLVRHGLGERDADQAITALKKGAYLLKYGRRGRPKFCPFRLSPDESSLIWYYGKQEKKIDIRNVTRILPGQRTAIFQRYPRPEKDYQSFSLLYDDRSLDLICKDKDEAEVWFAGLKALISRGTYRKIKSETRSDGATSDSSNSQKLFLSIPPIDLASTPRTENIGQSRLGKAFADIVSYTATNKNYNRPDTATHSLNSASPLVEEDVTGRCSTSEALRVSVSSAFSSSSHSSLHEDFDVPGDCFIWGEGTANGVLGGGELRINYASGSKVDSYFPKALESSTILNVRSIAGRSRHALLVTKHGEVYSWGEESGGRLGHGVDADVSHPKLIHSLTGRNIEIVECGEFHSCAITHSGDLYTWGDGTISCGLLGHGSKVSHWIPRKVGGLLEGLPISYVSCGPWHTALITSGGQLFTFGEGAFGALGHGDHCAVETPREVEAMKGFRSLRVACGAWHTAAVVVAKDVFEDGDGTIDGTSSGKLFTWGDGDKGRLGHADNKSRSVPECIASLDDIEFTKVACGCDLTVALTYTGRVYTMGSNAHGQLGSPSTGSMTPICVEGPLAESYVLEIACGSHHVAVLTSKSNVYTWGKGSNGQLGHGDYEDRRIPTLVDSLKDKQVKSITCGSNFTAIICLHKSVSADENSVCSGCQNAFSFRRKKHNCYNCGLVFCHACSSKRSLKASLAPSMGKPYRVCDDCFSKLQMAVDSVSSSQIPKTRNGSVILSRDSAEECSGPSRPRLSSSDSFKHEGRISKPSLRTEINDTSVSPIENGNATRWNFPSQISPTGPFGNFLAPSVPTMSASRTISPFSYRRSLIESAMTMFSLPGNPADAMSDTTTQTCGMPQEEIRWLKARVEVLVDKSNNLEAELEKKSIQLKEATTLAENEGEEKKAAMEVIKSLTEQLEEMANRVSEQRTTKSYSRPYSKHLNDPDNLPSGYTVNDKEKFNDNHLTGKHVANSNANLKGEQKLNDLNQKLGEHIANENSDLDAEKKLNGRNRKGRHITDDTSDLNVEQKLNGRKHKPGKHITDDYSGIHGEQKRKGLNHKAGKHITEDNSDPNSEQKINDLKHKPENYIEAYYSDHTAEQKWNGLKHKSGKHIVDDYSDQTAEQKWNGHKHKSGKHIVDDYSDHTDKQKWHGHKHKSGKHTIDDNSDFNGELKLNVRKQKLSKHIVDDYSDLKAEQNWNVLKQKHGKHKTDDNSDFKGGQKWNVLTHKADLDIDDGDSDLNVGHKRNGPMNKPGKHIADDNSNLYAEQNKNRLKHKSRRHTLNDNSDYDGELKPNVLKRKPSKHIVDDSSDLTSQQNWNVLKHKHGKHTIDDNSDFKGVQKWKVVKHKPDLHIDDGNSDLNAEHKQDGLKHKPGKHIVDDNSDLIAEQQWNGLKPKPTKNIANDYLNLNGDRKRDGLKHKLIKHIADDYSDLIAEQNRSGQKNKHDKHIVDGNSDLSVEQRWSGLKHKSGKHIVDQKSDLDAEQKWNGLKHKLGKHIIDDNSNLNVEQILLPDEQSNVTREATSINESSDSSTIPALSNKEKGETHKQERMIQDYPGVYVTLCELPNGGNELKRVRFSRKHFNEQEADKWWKENLSKVKRRHDIRIH